MNKTDRTLHSDQGGSALLLSLIALLLLFMLGSIIAGTLSRSLNQTSNEFDRVRGFCATEAAINRAVFYMEAKLADTYGNSWNQFCSHELYPNLSVKQTIHGNLSGIPYEFWFEDNRDVDGKDGLGNDIIDQTKDSDEMIWIYAKAHPYETRPRTARAIIHAPPPPRSLDYALFGNFVHFDNHNKAPFGVIMTTTVWSNSDVYIDSAIEIAGQVTAVEQVLLNKGPRGNSAPYTVVNPAPLQGDAGAIPPVITAVPAPEIIPFPTFDMELARSVATAHGTYFASGNVFMTYLKDASRKTTFTQTYGPPEDMRYIHVPHKSDLDQRFPVGDEDGNQVIDGGESFDGVLYHIQAQNVNDFSYNNVYFIDGDLDLKMNFNEIVRIEGSIICNGKLGIHTGGEILAYEERDSYDTASTLADATPADTNRRSILDGDGDGTEDRLVDLDGDGSVYDFRNVDPTTLGTVDVHYSDFPAIVALDGLKIDGKDYGPIHIEGAIYTADESHFHRSEPNGKAFVCGNEIADTVHNCEFISFFYDPEVKHTLGFAERLTGRLDLATLNFSEDPPVPHIPVN